MECDPVALKVIMDGLSTIAFVLGVSWVLATLVKCVK